jgi:hypothetical protein
MDTHTESTSLDASGFEIVWPSGWVEAEVAALSDTESTPAENDGKKSISVLARAANLAVEDCEGKRF